jgi:hypothetical protein
LLRARRFAIALLGGLWSLLFIGACAAPDPDLTGVWEARDSRGSLLSLWSFFSDGRFTYDHLPEPAAEDAEHLHGTFQIVGGAQLRIDAIDVGARLRLSNQTSFYVHAETLAPEAFVAEDAQPDLVGRWRQRALKQTLSPTGEVTFEDRRDQSLELFPDGQLRIVQNIDDGPAQEVPGRYEALGGDLYQLTLDLPQASIRFTLQLVNGQALAPRVYQRRR